MLAVAELAQRFQLGDLGEGRVDPVDHVRDAQSAHPRRVDQPAAAGQAVKRPARGGVPPARIILADVLRRPVPACQGVGQSGLADTGRADKGDGLPLAGPRRQFRGLGRVLGIQREHLQIAAKLLRLIDVGLRIVGLVGLGQQDHRCHLGIMRQREIPFQTGHVEIGVARGGDEQRVDIGGDQLAFAVHVVRPALQDRHAVQPADHARAVCRSQYPVANGDLGSGHAGVEDQVAQPVRCEDGNLGAVHAAHTGGRCGGDFVDFQLRLEMRRPSKVGKRGGVIQWCSLADNQNMRPSGGMDRQGTRDHSARPCRGGD